MLERNLEKGIFGEETETAGAPIRRSGDFGLAEPMATSRRGGPKQRDIPLSRRGILSFSLGLDALRVLP
jgi:hypothetical protein